MCDISFNLSEVFGTVFMIIGITMMSKIGVQFLLVPH